MSANPKPPPGEARCPGAPNVQQVLRADGDGDRQPDSYKLDSYVFLGDDDIPYERYTSPEFHKLEMERLWPRVWQWACREEHIPEPGDFYVYDIGPWSVIVTRTPSRQIKAYFNSCLHRGTKLKPSFSSGSAQQFSCPFHGWTWDLEGRMADLPCAWDFPHVDPRKASLPEVAVGLWGGFVFVNLDPNPVSFEEYIAPLPEHAKHAGYEQRYVALHVQKELPANWKICFEAFVEAYHVAVTHPQLYCGNGDINTQYDIFSDHVNRLYSLAGFPSPRLQRKVSEQEVLDNIVLGDRQHVGDDLTVPPGGTARHTMAAYFKKMLKAGGRDVDDRSTAEIIDTVNYTLFPNAQFFLAPSFPIVYRFRPLGMDHTKTLYDLLLLAPLPPGGERPEPYEAVRIKVEESYGKAPGVDPGLAEIFDQDTSNMGWMHEGMMAGRKRAGTLANYQEIRIRHLHRVIDKYLAKPPVVV